MKVWMEGTYDKLIQTMSCAQMWTKSSTSSKPCRSGRMRLVSPSSPSPQRTPTEFAFRMAMGESDYLCLCDDHLSLAPTPPIHRKHKSTICPYINFTLTNVKTVLSFIISCLYLASSFLVLSMDRLICEQVQCLLLWL